MMTDREKKICVSTFLFVVFRVILFLFLWLFALCFLPLSYLLCPIPLFPNAESHTSSPKPKQKKNRFLAGWHISQILLPPKMSSRKCLESLRSPLVVVCPAFGTERAAAATVCRLLTRRRRRFPTSLISELALSSYFMPP